MVDLQRTTFETSRAADFFDAAALQKETGQPRRNFAAVVLKELLDNALDACETARVAPEASVGVSEAGGNLRLTVGDNGPGIPPETVTDFLDFSVRVSDKAAYRSPTRGAQGNALKTVVGIPHALGSMEPVVIEARDVRHEIRAWVDPAGELRVEHDRKRTPNALGTRVTVEFPAEMQDFDPGFWCRAFAIYNPHAAISYHGNEYGAEAAKTYKSTDGDFKKYRPTDPTSAHWYSEEALRRLVFSHVGDHRRGGRDLPLGEFVRQFRGLSSSKKAKVVTDSFDGVSYLSGFERSPDEVGGLLTYMRENSKAPSHEALGSVGEEHFRARLENAYEVDEFTYRKAKGYFPSGLPFTFEVAVAVTREPGDLYFGVNFSPTFGDPLEGTRLKGQKFEADGILGFLREGHALPERYYGFENPANTAVAAHIITPSPMYMDRGKTRIALEGDNG